MIEDVIKAKQAIGLLGIDNRLAAVERKNQQFFKASGIRTINGNRPDGRGDITITTGSGGGGTGTDLSRSITQTAHGLAVGDAIKYTGTAYAKALADTSENAEVVGIVSIVTDANNFTLLYGGYISTLTSLTAGTVYFLSSVTPGLLTDVTPPNIGQVNKPLLIAVSTTTGYFFNFRGSIVGGAASGGGFVREINTISTNTTAGNTLLTDYVYLVSGTTTLTLPSAAGSTNLYTIKRIGTNNVTIATTSSQTIDGGLTAVLTSQYESISVVSNNSSWHIV